MSATIGLTQGAASSAIDSGARRFISEWTIGKKTICLFRDGARLAFSTDGRAGQTSTFKPNIYNIDYAINLVLMFHKTIEENLNREETHSSCFLPKLCTEAQNPDTQVALFGRVDARKVATGELQGLRWGIFSTTTKKEQVFDVNDEVAKAFVYHAPDTNIPEMKQVIDKNGVPVMSKAGKPMMKPGPNHYAYDSYVNRFCVLITRDDADRIQNVALHHVSLLDRHVLLDENIWAITLVSAQKSKGIASFLNLGHAVVAWEGVEENRSFLRWADITTDHSGNSQTAKVRIDTLNNPHKSWMIGPTWPRKRHAVEKMVSYVCETVDTPTASSEEASFVNFGLLASLKNLFKSVEQIEKERRARISVETCISFIVSAVQRADIFLPEPGRAERNTEPNAYIRSLQSNYSANVDPDSYIVYRHNDTGKRSDDIDTDDRIDINFLQNIDEILNG